MKQLRNQGFTLIEIMLAIIVLIILATFFVTQRSNIKKTTNDQQRKIAINSMYYALKNSYFSKNGYYPRSISRDQLKVIDPTLFTDPDGNTLEGDKCIMGKKNGKKNSNKCQYHYSATNCDNDGKCQQFILMADMELEANYRKSSQE